MSAAEDIKIGQECWFIHPDTHAITQGLVIGRLNIDGVWRTFLACGPDRQECVSLLMAQLFPSERDLREWMERVREEKRRVYRDMMPDLEECLRFARKFFVQDGQPVDPVSVETFEERVMDLTGNVDFWKGL